MKIFKNIMDDTVEYNERIKKYNSKNQLIDIAPIEVNKVITISLQEYKELLIYKGKYLGLTNESESITKTLYCDGEKVCEKNEI